jgi:hypothetical protein
MIDLPGDPDGGMFGLRDLNCDPDRGLLGLGKFADPQTVSREKLAAEAQQDTPLADRRQGGPRNQLAHTILVLALLIGRLKRELASLVAESKPRKKPGAPPSKWQAEWRPIIATAMSLAFHFKNVEWARFLHEDPTGPKLSEKGREKGREGMKLTSIQNWVSVIRQEANGPRRGASSRRPKKRNF